MGKHGLRKVGKAKRALTARGVRMAYSYCCLTKFFVLCTRGVDVLAETVAVCFFEACDPTRERSIATKLVNSTVEMARRELGSPKRQTTIKDKGEGLGESYAERYVGGPILGLTEVAMFWYAPTLLFRLWISLIFDGERVQ